MGRPVAKVYYPSSQLTKSGDNSQNPSGRVNECYGDVTTVIGALGLTVGILIDRKEGRFECNRDLVAIVGDGGRRPRG